LEHLDLISQSFMAYVEHSRGSLSEPQSHKRSCGLSGLLKMALWVMIASGQSLPTLRNTNFIKMSFGILSFRLILEMKMKMEHKKLVYENARVKSKWINTYNSCANTESFCWWITRVWL